MGRSIGAERTPVLAFTALVALFVPVSPAAAQEPGSEPRPSTDVEDEAISPYRNPTGSFALSGMAGIGIGSERTQLAIGAGLGYAVVTGVMPGARGLLLVGDGVGGELAATLTLTPPLAGSWTPFVVGEAGRRWEPDLQGWLYGFGGGVYIGDPASTFTIQLGWVQRWWLLGQGQTLSFGAPLLGFSFRF